MRNPSHKESFGNIIGLIEIAAESGAEHCDFAPYTAATAVIARSCHYVEISLIRILLTGIEIFESSVFDFAQRRIAQDFISISR